MAVMDPSADLATDFKDALASWASGVTVVTTRAGGLLYGLTVSSFTSVSLDPPLILVCLATTNRMGEMIGQSRRFGVSILGREQEAASNYFASPGREPTEGFVEIEGQWTDYEVPIVQGALAHVVCDLHDSTEVGDHLVVVGRVIHAEAERDGEPLVYWRRRYRGLDAG